MYYLPVEFNRQFDAATTIQMSWTRMSCPLLRAALTFRPSLIPEPWIGPHMPSSLN